MPYSAGKLAFPMLLSSCAPSVPWAVRMRPPICVTVERTVLWLGLVVGCLFLAAGVRGQVFGSVSSGPYLVPVGSRGNWYDLCLHHLQLPHHNHLTKNNVTHHQRLPPLAWCSAFHHFLCVVFLPLARQRWRWPPCCTRGCPPNSASFTIVPSYPGTQPNAVGAPRTTRSQRNISIASWSPSDRTSATTTSFWNLEGPTGCTPMAHTLINCIQHCCHLFSPSITSRIRSRFLVGTFPMCVHIVTASHCQTNFGDTSLSTYLHGCAIEAVPHDLWSLRFHCSMISPARSLAVTTWTATLLTPSRVTAAHMSVWDRGKMPTKRGKSTKLFIGTPHHIRCRRI